MDNVRVVLVGAGPIGVGVAREIAARRAAGMRIELVAVVDIDPHKQGQLVEGVAVTSSLPAAAHVAVLTTTSSLARIEPQVMDALARGMAVVSSCEELFFPHSQPEIAARLDAAAQAAGRAVLGTGVNPGFLMDALPLALTAPCRRVERVRVERVQDPSTRRRPFQDKVGVGGEPAVVEQLLAAGKTGHVGLRESALFLGAKLGFSVDIFREEQRVIVAEDVVERAGRRIEPGQVLGVEQTGRAWSGGIERVELFFRAVWGEPQSHDRIQIVGEPALDVTLAGGVPGDVATCAIVVNAIPAVLDARPGLRTMAEVPVAWRAH